MQTPISTPFQTLLSVGAGAAALLLLASAPAALSTAPDEELCADEAKSECGCDACGLSEAAPEELLSQYLEGVLPETTCEELKPHQRAQFDEFPASFYGELVGYRADAPKVVYALVARYTEAHTSSEDRERLLDLATMFPARVPKTAVAKLWDADADAFGLEHILAFGTSGTEGMHAVVAERAEHEVLPAATLALRGDARGAKVLLRAVEGLDLASGDGCEAALAALGLARLGKPQALETVRDAFEGAALAALDGGELERARTLALRAEFLCKKLVHAQGGAQLGWLSERAQWHVRARSTEVAEAGDVFTVIEGLRS